MKSQTLPQFWKRYYQLPKDIRRRAARAYRIWRDDPYSPELHFKRVGKRRPVYSVRVGDFYRVLGLLEDGTIYWFWIGDHKEYDRLLKGM